VKVAFAAAVLAAAATASAAADSFTPVRLVITVAPVARLHQPLPITVNVSADAGVLDNRFAPLRIEVRLTRQCGGTFQTTSGAVLLNRRLNPQPATGKPYLALARGAGRPRSFGLKTVCVYLEEQGDNRVWAHEESVQVKVSRPCTLAAARYDRTHRARDRRAARRACGAGVSL
jgi:hypothetical protein